MKSLSYLSLSALFLASASAQPAINCNATAVPLTVHAEGVSERLGDIVLTCTGAAPGTTLSGNLNVYLNTNVTNKLSPQNFADVILTVDTGTGPVLSSSNALISGANLINFNGVSATFTPSGTITFRISNIRGSANLLPPGGIQPLTASISFTGTNPVFSNQSITIGFSQRSVLASVLPTVIASQFGSPLPDTPSFTSFLAAGTRFGSARVTEDWVGAFQKREQLADNGVRIISRYSNVPAGARIFVPNVIAGSNATVPTKAGDFGGTPSGGQYTPASSTLLLVRVQGTDVNGAGGSLTYTPGATGSGVATFDSVAEVQLTNGSGIAVFEVVDSDPSVRESAQIPSFTTIPGSVDARSLQSQQDIVLGPISTVPTSSPTAPVPRFTPSALASDCTILGDCSGAYLPKLSVDPDPLTTVVAQSGASFQIRYIRVLNTGGSTLIWNASVTYKNGSGWLRLSPQSNVGEARLRVDFIPAGLAPGVYEATLTIDAGFQAGVINLPVKLTVTQPVPPSPIITSVINAATYQAGPLVRGSYGTIKGSNLLGTNVLVALDGTQASVSYDANDQINFIVPPTLTPRQSAQLTVTVNGVSSSPQTVPLANVAPGIFNPGILNQDNTINTATNPAVSGSFIQIFTTGLLPPEGGTVDVKIHDRLNLIPVYAGIAPGIPGLQQVNVRVPADLQTVTTQVVVCGTVAGVRVCSDPLQISVRQ
jgi:uncharacterized protein (TIGR03437 family)